MLIGIDANEANLTSHRVGVNQYAFDLLHALYKYRSEHNFQIYLKTPPQNDLPKEDSTWKYRVIPFPKLWTQTRLPIDLFLKSPRPDVFFSMTHYAPRWTPIPSVIAIMDLGFLMFPEQFNKKDLSQLTNWTKYSVSQAKAIISISEHTKKDILKNYNVPSEKVFVTYPGYDEKNFFPHKNQSVLKKYNINNSFILFLSSLKPSKNIPRLIEAYASLKPKESLVIAGKKGWMYDEIFALVKKHSLEDRVIFTGFLEETEVPILMSMCQCFVLPSIYEGFGIPVLEAMACGVPVVTSNVASLPEVAGDAGIYVDPYSIDSITQGIKKALGKERQKFVSKSLKRVKSFSWDICAQKTLICLKTATINH